ncbi:hypothetical protein [Methanopyrus sp.]
MRVLDAKKVLLTVSRHRLDETDFKYKDVGLCLVVGFEGSYRNQLWVVISGW